MHSPCKRQISIFLAVCIFLQPILFCLPEVARAYDLLPTLIEVTVSCGNGYTEMGEVCDPGDAFEGISPSVGSTTCDMYDDIYGNPFVSGDMSCLGDCTDYDPDGCFTCGNTNKEASEGCDANDFGGDTCITLGFSGGTLFCTGECNISTANCTAMVNEGGNTGGGSSGGGGGTTRTGFDPGSLEDNETKVIIKGKSYPNSDVHILVDGKVTGIVRTDSKADFYFETSEIGVGVVSFGFWSEDAVGLKSTLLNLTFRVISGAVTTITGVYIAPTIDVDKQSVRQGEDIMIFGQTVPASVVNIFIHSDEEHIVQTETNEKGTWNIVFDTTPLEEAFHVAKANFQVDVQGNIIKSGFSKSVSFAISKLGGEAICAEADLNGDGRVNLTDFSILLFHWGTDDPCADQNQNGVVDLIDFSIMMYYWTG